MAHPAFVSITEAKANVLVWALAERIPLHTIEYVATFEEWDHGIGVWIFYKTDADLRSNSASGTNAQLQQQILSGLRSANYPFAQFPEVVFNFDSHENVVRNFQGNYFYRLR